MAKKASGKGCGCCSFKGLLILAFLYLIGSLSSADRHRLPVKKEVKKIVAEEIQPPKTIILPRAALLKKSPIIPEKVSLTIVGPANYQENRPVAISSRATAQAPAVAAQRPGRILCYKAKTGNKYHLNPDCSVSGDSRLYPVTDLQILIKKKAKPCKNCWKGDLLF